MAVKLGFYTCGNCGFANLAQKNCMLKGHQIEATDFCSRHKQNVPVCDRCHRLLTQPIIVCQEGAEAKIYCRQCYNSLF